MTQPSTSDTRLSGAQFIMGQGKLTEETSEQSSLPNSAQPAIVHPNFDPHRTPLDPARSLRDIPEPARRVNGQLLRLYGKSANFYQPNKESLSKWQLVASEPFAEYLALLSAAQLMAMPDSFYRQYRSDSTQPLLASLEQMTLLDMTDIQQAINNYPKLTRYGFLAADNSKTTITSEQTKSLSLRALTKQYDSDELLNSIYADDWQVILQPQQFENGIGSLVTDIMACSVAVHALKQCDTRKSINQSYSAEQICQHVRSYLLSQACFMPALRYQYRQIQLFTGHIIVAAYHLGWDIQVHDDGQCYFNLSSRCSLLTRYANMQDYNINGWSS